MVFLELLILLHICRFIGFYLAKLGYLMRKAASNLEIDSISFDIDNCYESVRQVLVGRKQNTQRVPS